jgi:alpha-L-rhamnosidase
VSFIDTVDPSSPLAANQSQSAYQIQVSGTYQFDPPSLWDSGKHTSNNSVQIYYGGVQLQSFQAAYWRVKMWDASGMDCGWSPEIARW